MPLVQQIDADLKQALLSGDKELVSVLRGLKSVILYEEVAQNKRDSGLDEQAITSLLQKEVKKRQEAIQLYEKANDEARVKQEQYEVEVINKYLPEMMDETEVNEVVNKVIAELDVRDITKMGFVISEVKKRTEGRADGALIAKLVKEKLG